MSFNRSVLLDNQKHVHYDLLVIGGGITGAGIALDAASRGMKVALVDKGDFASGTSSKSTKLIHGGLRYLKQFEWGLVRRVGTERAILHRLAPHLVIPEMMLLPIFRNGSLSFKSTSIGLWLYDWLAGVSGPERRRMVLSNDVRTMEPLLSTNELLGAGCYAEYRTDDSRLTIEIIKTAIRKGADCTNYTAVSEFIYHEGKIIGAACFDKVIGQPYEIMADCVVSSTGPWVDQLRKKDNSLRGKRLFLSKGVHIVVPHSRLPLKSSVYFDTPDKRMVFAIPRQRATYIGTTDTPYTADPEHVYADADDVDYLLHCTNSIFPSAQLGRTDVESTWAGLRPLIHEDGKPPGEMSRKDELFISESGLISIAGGKLTGYRLMAKKVVDLVVKKLALEKHKSFQHSLTEDIPLGSQPFANFKEALDFKHFIQEKIKPMNLPSCYGSYLVENYGREALAIADHAIVKEFDKDPVLAIMKCELEYCLEHEMVIKPADFFERRTGRLHFHYDSIGPALEPLLDVFQQYLKWDEQTKTGERDDFLKLMKAVKNF